MFDKMLVALDDTETSSRAFTMGLEIARRFGGEMHLCSVIEHVVAQADVLMGAVDDIVALTRQHAELTHKFLIDRAEREGVKVVSHILSGEPVETIVQLADTERVDAIVIGGLGRRVRLFGGAGSGAKIARFASCTVVVAR
jgi:nucleotide-binding universal stress UspA family protein